MTATRVLFLCIVCLLLAAGCASRRPAAHSVSLVDSALERVASTDSKMVEQGKSTLEPAQRERSVLLKGRPAAASLSRKGPERPGMRGDDFPSGQTGIVKLAQVNEQSQSGLLTEEEPDQVAGTSSLFIEQGEGEDEDLKNLLSSTYLQQFDIPIVFNDAVQYFVRYFSTEKRKIFANWLRRSRRYVPMIRGILREHGLPEDLAFVAMIESGFNPKAYSSMKACGPWQFIYETGGRYGLKVDHWVDERRDPEKSTIAAALYLKDLFNQFGDWYLAAAGYNAGEKRIERAVEKHETADFWEITKYNTLPKETRDYIPRLIASAIIAKDPERFGFANIVYDKPNTFVSEKVPGGMPLTTIARVASTDSDTLRSLNPELLTGITPPDVSDYTIKLPGSTIRGKFAELLRDALDSERKLRGVITYTCKPKESIASIAKRYKVSKKDILMVNDCDRELLIQQGRVVYIPHFAEPADVGAPHSADIAVEERNEPKVRTTEAKLEGPDEERKQPAVTKAAGSDQVPTYHLVRKGETLAAISNKYGIETIRLKEMNGLRKNTIHPDMRLRLAVQVRKDRKGERTVAYHKVKKGATLSGIADRQNVAMSRLKKINRLKKNDARPGIKRKLSSGRIKPSKRG